MLAGSAAVVAVIFLPWRTRPAALELVALGGDGQFQASVQIPPDWMDTSDSELGAVARVPLVLAVVNSGGRAAQPEHLELSVPLRLRLATAQGKPLPGRLAAGSPLVRYELTPSFPSIEPGRLPTLVPAMDTLWLELVVPNFYCIALSDSVPDFVPAPVPDAESLSRITIFYSFGGGELDHRQTGLLRVQVDPGLLQREVPPPPPVFKTELRRPEMPLPPMGALRYVGSRHAFCGAPEAPIEILSTLWETPEGGRFFVLDHGGAPRKYLFDLNRDGIVELEMWDPDGEGRFVARRAAQFPIPAFLMPPIDAPTFDPSFLAALSEEELAQYDAFAGASRGFYKPKYGPPDTTTRLSPFRSRVLAGTLDDKDPRRPSRRPGEPARTTVATDAGRRVLGTPAPGTARPAPPRARDEATPPARAGEQPARPTTGAGDERPAPRPRREIRLLGRPVDSIPAPPQRPPDG